MVAGCIAVCKAIQHHSTLRELYLSNNFIGPDGARHVAKVLENTKYITEIWLSGNGIFPSGAQALGKALREKRYLEVLALRKNDLGIEGLSELESVLQSSKTIRELDLGCNAIGDEGVRIVTSALKNKQKQQLCSLNLSENSMTSQGCIMVCDLINRCPTLNEIQLQNNQIDNSGAQQLVDAIQNRNFTKLDIDNNKISGQVLSALLVKVPVRKLNLVRNKLSDPQVEPIKQSLVANRDLKILHMSHNNLSDNALGMLAEGLTVNSGIEEIQFTHNDLSLPNGQTVIRSLKNMPQLEKLSMNSCNMINPCLEALREALTANTTLTDISLYSNEIDAEGA